MTYLTGLLPVAQGVAVFAALTRAADSARASGDPRGRGQIMADTLVERVTGQRSAEGVPLRVNLVISDDVLFGADGHAHIEGYGPVPGDLARDLAARTRQKWLRRLYASPDTGELVAMESRSRTFPKGLGQLIDLRDQTCRTPWCDARSATTTTSERSRMAARPALPMARVSARPATTPSRRLAGSHVPDLANPHRGDPHPDRAQLSVSGATREPAGHLLATGVAC